MQKFKSGNLSESIKNTKLYMKMEDWGWFSKDSSRKAIQGRTRFIAMFITAAFILCIFRLSVLQVINPDEHRSDAQRAQLSDKMTPAKRGTIYDANGNVLAESADVWRIYVDPKNVRNEEMKVKLSEDLSKMLDCDKKDVYDALSKKNSRYCVIKKSVEYELKEKVKKYRSETSFPFFNEETGKNDFQSASGVIGIEPDIKRYYPNGDSAGHIIGYAGPDGSGRAGLEFKYNSLLSGIPGRIVTAKDAVGNEIPQQRKKLYEAKQGTSLQLTIDQNIQMYLESALDQAYIDNKCASANGIVMDVNTGAVLAMATREGYDPNHYNEVDEAQVQKEYEKLKKIRAEKNKGIALTKEQKEKDDAEDLANARQNVIYRRVRNRCISDTYEPGSVFKTITACASLEQGTATPKTKVECKPGGIHVLNRTYHCANHNVHGTLDMVGGLKKSCNSYFITMGQNLGVDNFFKYFEAFGFTEKTGIDLPAEAQPIFHPHDKMTKVDLASSSFGQSFQVTPIQMITALSAIANGGKLMKPYVVAKTLDDKGSVLTETKPEVRRQVISEQTSDTVCEMLRKVVNEGTAKNGYVAGYRVAGKTGTSQKLGISKKGEYIASYGCFAPADDAKIAVIIIVDEPHGGQIHGGQICAPIAARVVENTLKYMNVEPRFSEEEVKNLDVVIPKFTDMQVDGARKKIEKDGFKCRIVGSGKKVIRQIPGPYQTVPRGGVIVLYTEEGAKAPLATVPDLTGLTLTQASQRAASFGINVKISGNTLVNTELLSYGQSIQAGKNVQYGTTVTVYFKSNTDVSDLSED